MNTIKVEVENLDKNKLMLKEHLGDGIMGKTNQAVVEMHEEIKK